MISVIFAGGSGTRLWPLSRSDYPKHLLELNGSGSLLQQAVNRAAGISSLDKIYIISEVSHVSHIYTQLPDIPKDNIIIEPSRKGTASCVLYALAHIRNTHSASEPIIFLHSDHLIEDVDSFCETLRIAEKTSIDNDSITLLGHEPTFASTGFGYVQIKPIELGSSVSTVKLFKEKPDKQTAQSYLDSGDFLWNMGYFTASINVFEREIKQHAPTHWKYYQSLLTSEDPAKRDEIYNTFHSEPIDTALIEKLDHLYAVTCDYEWSDVGSYLDLYSIRSKDSQNNAITGNVYTHNTTDSIIHNDTNIPIASVGLSNVVLVATHNGILAMNIHDSQDVKKIVEQLNS